MAIMGGGLAGLTLALQLRQRFPALDIVVLERHRHPVPEGAHKVGESTVEIGAHYFETILGLQDHLNTCQLRKFGFRFFFTDRHASIDQVVEVGVSRYLATPSYQIDRGIFENFLARHVCERGVRFIDGATISAFSLSPEGHHVTYACDGREHALVGRWLIDASGRAGLIKRHLGLAERNEHAANSVWFRIGSRINVDTWSTDADWLNRCDPPDRWRSTNHLMGPGYWVWLIPLACGSHSVGIVADPRLHPLRRMSSFERSLDWLREHQPQLARELDAKRDQLQDFLLLRGFSYGCRQVFSGSRWALTGEAGVFLDPFYSPGSDFIAIANTYITALIARDLAGEPVEPYARMYEQFYFSFYRSTLSLYVDQYPMFGDPEVMPVKVIWDYTFYWGVLCQLFFQGRLTDLSTLSRVRSDLTATQALNELMQPFLREWSRVSRKRNAPVMHDQARLDWFAELNRGLRDQLDDDAFRARVRANTELLYNLAAEIVERASTEHPELDASGLRALLKARDGIRASGLLVEKAA